METANEMDKDFELAWIRLLVDEGDYSNDPEDPGGETKWGITRRTFLSFGYSQEQWEKLTISDARQWYHDNIWKPYHYDKLLPEYSALMFNLGVLEGNEDVIRAAQAAYNRLTPESQHLKVDGIIGPFTIRALEEFDYPDALCFLIKLTIATQWLERPHSERFLRGWLNRIDSL